MDYVERKIRQFRAALYVAPGFANWVRTRGYELTRAGQKFEIVLVWGRRRFRVGSMPLDDPYFAIERADGSVERSCWVRE